MHNKLTLEGLIKKFTESNNALSDAYKTFLYISKSYEEDEEAVLNLLREKIESACSNDFFDTLDKPLTGTQASVSGLTDPKEETTQLDYLFDVILATLLPFDIPTEDTDAAQDEQDDYWGDRFLLPGNYEEGKAFFEKHAEDFEKIAKMVRNIEYCQDKDVTDSFVLKFSKSEIDFVS